MTNYNGRLDKILFNLTDQSAWDLMGTTQEQHNELTAQLIVDRAAAKQAITSLIKELVAEAKIEKLNDELNYSTYGEGHDTAIDQFEQNLLKVLGYEDEK